MGSTPRGSEVGNCSEHFLDREKYFWRGGLPVVVEHGFHPSGFGGGGIVVNIFWTEKNIFGEGGLPVVVEHGFHPSGLGGGWNCSEHFLDREKYFSWRS